MFRKKSRFLFLFFAGLFCILLGWTLWANTALQVTHYTIPNQQLPKSFSGFRIAQVSDLHNTAFGEDNHKLLDLLRSEKPDIIVITGDLVDSPDHGIALSFAEQVVQIAPTYYITGNHEAYISNYPQLEKGLLECGVAVLHNETVLFQRDEETISLSGLDDPQFGTLPQGVTLAEFTDYRLSNMGLAESDYHILLAHRPERISTYAQFGYHLVLSGHVHGGQIRLPLIGGLYAPNQGWLPEYDCGIYTVSGTNMIVSRGLGNSRFPLRFNNRPEIVIVDLISEK